MTTSLLLGGGDMKAAILFSVIFSFTSAQEVNHDLGSSNYFVRTPKNTTVRTTSDMDTMTLYGDFSCATRLGYLPLWVINGVSIDLILEEAAYNGTYTEFIPLLEGNLLSFISIPALPATNNSIVACAALLNSSEVTDVVAYSEPVRMIVLQRLQIVSSAVSVTVTPTSTFPHSSSVPGSHPTTESRAPNARDSKLVIISLSVVCGLVCIVIITLISVGILVLVLRYRRLNKIEIINKGGGVAHGNIYSIGSKEKTENNDKLNWGDDNNKGSLKDFPQPSTKTSPVINLSGKHQ